MSSEDAQQALARLQQPRVFAKTQAPGHAGPGRRGDRGWKQDLISPGSATKLVRSLHSFISHSLIPCQTFETSTRSRGCASHWTYEGDQDVAPDLRGSHHNTETPVSPHTTRGEQRSRGVCCRGRTGRPAHVGGAEAQREGGQQQQRDQVLNPGPRTRDKAPSRGTCLDRQINQRKV